MKMPFPDILMRNTCTIKIYGDKNSNGVKSLISTKSYKCYFEQGAKVIRSATGERIKVLSLVVIKGDVTGLTDNINHEVVIGGNTYKVESVERLPNLDNSIHHTEVMVV